MKRRAKQNSNDITQYQGDEYPKTVRDSRNYTNWEGNTHKRKGKSDNSELTLWQGEDYPRPSSDPSVYTQWQGNSKGYGKPGPNQGTLFKGNNLRIRTVTLWKNVPGHQKREMPKPTYSKSEKGIWAE
jgi:hypothetical protein